MTGRDLHLGPDAGPSLALLVPCCWLALRWTRALRPAHPDFLRPALWEETDPSPPREGDVTMKAAVFDLEADPS